MAYYTKVLLPDEQVRTVGRLHWAIYLKSWLSLTLAALAGVAYLYFKSPGADPTTDTAALVPGGAAVIFLLFGVFLMLSAWLRRVTTEIVVTDRRVIFKEGFIRRRTMEMNMSKVETVDVVQSISGRIFNYGTILIRGTGSSYEPLGLIGNPLALRTAIVTQ
jgi:uncharacterized membrane protein YdbT with pleckstrin-like domain